MKPNPAETEGLSDRDKEMMGIKPEETDDEGDNTKSIRPKSLLMGSPGKPKTRIKTELIEPK
jgi:hypothetical protein